MISLPWGFYQRKGTSQMRPYIPGEDLTGISVDPEDTPEEGGMIARNPKNPNDEWYVSREYFEKNLVPIPELTQVVRGVQGQDEKSIDVDLDLLGRQHAKLIGTTNEDPNDILSGLVILIDAIFDAVKENPSKSATLKAAQ